MKSSSTAFDRLRKDAREYGNDIYREAAYASYERLIAPHRGKALNETFGKYLSRYRATDAVEINGLVGFRHDLAARLEAVDPDGNHTAFLLETHMTREAAFECGVAIDFLLRRIAAQRAEINRQHINAQLAQHRNEADR